MNKTNKSVKRSDKKLDIHKVASGNGHTNNTPKKVKRDLFFGDLAIEIGRWM